MHVSNVFMIFFSRVVSIKTEKKHKGRPNALNTVDLLKVASACLGMDNKHLNVRSKLTYFSSRNESSSCYANC